MTGEPTAMQLAAAVRETACSELRRGASGDRSLRAPGSEPGSDGGVSDQWAGRQQGNDRGACMRRSSATATTALRTDW